MRQEFAEYHAGKQARKQEKLAYKRQKKHPDDADHWTGQQWSQRTRKDGLKAGMNQPVVHPPDGTRNGRDPKRLEVTLPPGPLVVQYSAA